MILIAYDGSDHAKAAVAAAAALMPGTEAVVVTAWEPYVDGLARVGAVGLGGLPQEAGDGIDEQLEVRAATVAAEGARLAEAAGLRATGTTEPTHGPPAATILDAAERLDASAIVLGSRGHGRIASLLLGSTSQRVLHHSTRPVVVVTSPTADGPPLRSVA